MPEIFDRIEQKIEELEHLIDREGEDNEERSEELYYDIKQKLDEQLEIMPPEDKLVRKFGQLQKRLVQIGKRIGIDNFDADRELDMMFPNRKDDDFDEDAMSYESVFGDD